MRTVKFICFCIALSLLCTFIIACGEEQGYRDDVTVESVVQKINPTLSRINDLDRAPENYIKIQQSFPLDLCLEYAEMMQVGGVGIDEYGIFKMKDAESVTAMKTAIESYLTTALATFNEDYAPNEKPKLESAEVKVFGNYVMYAVLSDSEKAAAFSALETALKK